MDISINSASLGTSYSQAQSAYMTDPASVYADAEFFSENIDQYKLDGPTKEIISRISELIRSNRDDEPSFAYVAALFQLLGQLDGQNPGFLSGSKVAMFGGSAGNGGLKHLIQGAVNARMKAIGVSGSEDASGLTDFKKDLIKQLKKMLADGIGSLDELIDVIAIARLLGRNIPRGIKNLIADEIHMYMALAKAGNSDPKKLLMLVEMVNNLTQDLDLGTGDVTGMMSHIHQSGLSILPIEKADEADTDMNHDASQAGKSIAEMAKDEKIVPPTVPDHMLTTQKVENFYAKKPKAPELTDTDQAVGIQSLNDSVSTRRVTAAHNIIGEFSDQKPPAPLPPENMNKLSDSNGVSSEDETNDDETSDTFEPFVRDLQNVVAQHSHVVEASIMAMFSLSLERHLDGLLESSNAITPLFHQD